MTALAELTTTRIGGAAREIVTVADQAEFIDAIDRVDTRGDALLVLGGGSNLLVADDGFDGVVLRDSRHSVQVAGESPGSVTVRVSAGTRWDDLVDQAVGQGWSGIEALSGIPGSVGATPVQNVGAYGQDVSQTIRSVRVWDRHLRQVCDLSTSECEFGYRTSVLKRSLTTDDAGTAWHPTPRYVVLEVEFVLGRSDVSAPVTYPQLAAALGVAMGEGVPLREARQTVLAIRAAKGMVLDAGDHDTWSTGSFFTNPILDAANVARLPEAAPRFAADDGVKTSAAWLIEHCGFTRGWGLPGSAATVSTKHTLALTNRGGASAADIVELACAIRDGVLSTTGIVLEPEPVLVGLSV